MNEKSIGAKINFQVIEDMADFKKCHVHDTINQVKVGGLISAGSTYLDQYLYGASELHIHFGWMDKREHLRGNDVAEHCIVLKKVLPCSQDVGQLNWSRKVGNTETSPEISPTTADGDNFTVLVSVFEATNDSQYGTMGIGSHIVRLQPYHECPSLWTQPLKAGFQVLPFGVAEHEVSVCILSKDVLKKDWETRLIPMLSWGTSNNEPIKCTTQVMYEISQHDGNHRVRLLRNVEATPDCIIAIKEPDTVASVRMAFCVPHGFLIDVYHVLLCPLNLEIPAIHMLNSEYEEGKSEDAKNSKGTRDSHTNTRGVRTKSKKGNKPRQITTSQPEEVTPQTSPDHHHGDYTAKNTHLGSPEDV